jgi:heptosyltransferase-2
VGDVILGVPMLRLLQANGYELHLVGKRWAHDLLLGEGWSVQTSQMEWAARVRQLRKLRAQCLATDPEFDQRLNAITLPFSFSSAFEMRCAGLRAVGVAGEARSLLLGHALPRSRGQHELQAYLELATPFVPTQPSLSEAPVDIALTVSEHHQLTADALCLAHRIEPGFVMLCPFAGGTFDKKPKTWPGFFELSTALRQLGYQLVLCPGPGEESKALDVCPHGVILDGVNLGVYAALLRRSALMVSNDTGPGHLAAAVGAVTLSVLGPTNPAQWRPWGSRVHLVQEADGRWPEPRTVIRRAIDILRTTTPEPEPNAD